jgi:hypothetical protein
LSLTDAQDAALRRLVHEGVLSAEQGEAVRAALALATPPARAGWLVEVAGYLGGALILAAAGLFLGSSWDSLSRPARSLVLAGFALASVLAGVVVAGGPLAVRRLAGGSATARRRVVGVLFALASVPAGFAVAVALDRHAGSAASGVAFAVALAGLLLLPTVAGVVATAATSWYALLATSGDLHATRLTTGLLSMVLGLLWCALALLRRVAPRPLGLALGLGIAVLGAQWPLGQEGAHPWAYGLTFALAVACFLAYRWVPDPALLVGGVLGATLAVPEAVADWTNGKVGGSVILLVAGVVLVAVSGVGLRLRAATAPERRADT